MTDAPSTPPAWWRLFVAVGLPDAIKERWREEQQDWRKRLEGFDLQWADPTKAHLTLKFLGDVAQSALEELRGSLIQACQAVSPFHLEVSGLGSFPEGRFPRVFWMGLIGEVGVLQRLQREVDRAMEPWAPRERRPFTPHVTVARVRRQDRALAAAWERLSRECEARLGEWEVSQVELVRSELLPQGARHTCLAIAPLEGRPPTEVFP